MIPFFTLSLCSHLSASFGRVRFRLHRLIRGFISHLNHLLVKGVGIKKQQVSRHMVYSKNVIERHVINYVVMLIIMIISVLNSRFLVLNILKRLMQTSITSLIIGDTITITPKLKCRPTTFQNNKRILRKQLKLGFAKYIMALIKYINIYF